MRPESVMLLVLMAALLFVMFTRTRRQRREVQQIQAGLAPGVDIMTASGLFATIVSIEDDVVVLETAPGQRSRWDRRAVARVIPPPSGPTGHPAGDETAEESPGKDGGSRPGQAPDAPSPDRG